MEMLGGEYINVIRPIRGHRGSLVIGTELCRAINLAAGKLRQAVPPGDAMLILVMLDADNDLPCELAPQLLEFGRNCRADFEIACVLPNVEFETWFVSAANSLEEYLNLPAVLPENPERERLGKGWVQQCFKGPKYSETIDQPRMTARMNLQNCRDRCASFDKLCRELEARR